MTDEHLQPIQRWSRDKLELLGKYLDAYATIMRAQRAERGWLHSFAYIDAFANEGAYQDPESRELVHGSPLVAVQSDPPFDQYWFIERSEGRATRLAARLTEAAPGQHVRVVQGDANLVLRGEVVSAFRYENYTRALVFLDPYGFQVEWETVKALAETRAIDIFVNFPIMAVNRLLNRDRAPEDSVLALFQRIMGSVDWIQDVYVTQPSLLEEVADRTERPRFAADRLAEIYITNVKKLFPYASDPVVMRNSQRAPLYALFLASHNQSARRIMNDISRLYQARRTID